MTVSGQDPCSSFWMDAVVLGLAGYWYGDV